MPSNSTTATARPGSSWPRSRPGGATSRPPIRCWRRPWPSIRCARARCSSPAGSRMASGTPPKPWGSTASIWSVHPGDQATRRRLVNLLADAGRHAEAYREAVIVRRAQPDDPDAIGVEADLALRVGHVAQADELLDQLIGSRSGRPRARGAGGRHPGAAGTRARGRGADRGLGPEPHRGLSRPAAGGPGPLGRRAIRPGP